MVTFKERNSGDFAINRDASSIGDIFGDGAVILDFPFTHLSAEEVAVIAKKSKEMQEKMTHS